MSLPEHSPYSAMTVNERLIQAGLFAEFERAAHAHATEQVEELLAKVALSAENIRAIVEWLYTSPHSIYREKKP